MPRLKPRILLNMFAAILAAGLLAQGLVVPPANAEVVTNEELPHVAEESPAELDTPESSEAEPEEGSSQEDQASVPGESQSAEPKIVEDASPVAEQPEQPAAVTGDPVEESKELPLEDGDTVLEEDPNSPWLPQQDPAVSDALRVKPVETGMAMMRAAVSPLSAGFKAGNIISDANFYGGGAMSVAQIQSFLNARVPNCTIGTSSARMPGVPIYGSKVAAKCLKDATFSSQNRVANTYCNAYAGGTNERAARIISKVAKACGVSERVLLVMLEKEQSLVTDTWPTVRQFDVAMGYACPDSGPNNSANCDPTQTGFMQQVYRAAWQLKVYKAHPTSYGYRPFQKNKIQWHPNVSCGTSNVYIENYATAALYIYTPYRPNQVALNAGWGTGNSCSTYGNRNFYMLYKQWFGVPTTFFSDVFETHRYFKEIEWMGANGISNGTKRVQGVMYDPLNGVTRRAMAAFLYRTSGSPKVVLPKESPFSDVKQGDSFYKEIVWMHQNGLANGYKKSGSKPEYGPLRPVTRGAMAAFMFRLTPGTEKYVAPTTPVFADLTRQNQFYREISWMKTEGLSSGYENGSGRRIYKSGTTVTRQAMAAFLFRVNH